MKRSDIVRVKNEKKHYGMYSQSIAGTVHVVDTVDGEGAMFTDGDGALFEDLELLTLNPGEESYVREMERSAEIARTIAEGRLQSERLQKRKITEKLFSRAATYKSWIERSSSDDERQENATAYETLIDLIKELGLLEDYELCCSSEYTDTQGMIHPPVFKN